MKQLFIKILGLVVVLNLIVKTAWVFIDIKIQNVIGPGEYGIYFPLFQFTMLFYILLDMGVTNFNNRTIAQHHQLVDKYFSNILGFKLILGVGYAAICLIVAFLLGYNAREFHILYFLIFNQLLLSFILYFRSNISGLQYYKTDSVVSILDKLFLVAITFFLLVDNSTRSQFRIEWLVYSQTVAYLITAIISFFIIFSKISYFKFRVNWLYFKLIFKQSFPYALLILLMFFYSRLDSVMLERLLSSEGNFQAGIYAQSFRIYEYLNNYAWLFASLLLPMFSRMLKIKEPVGSLIKLSYTLLIIPSAIICLACIFYARPIITTIFEETTSFSPVVFQILMISFLFLCTMYIFSTLLTANANMKELNIIAGSAVALNISLNLILIPKYLALGAAFSNLITQVFIAVSQVVVVYHIFHFKLEKSKLIAFIAFFAFYISSGIILVKIINLAWIIEFIVLVVVGAVGSFLFRLIDARGLLKIIKSREEAGN
ncbi:MAG: oligosaccharide flippase family protein [Bacteroidota bacterium]